MTISPVIKQALRQQKYESLLEFVDFSFFALEDMSDFRGLSLPIPAPFLSGIGVGNETHWRSEQPVVDALLTGYDTGQITVTDLLQTMEFLMRARRRAIARRESY